MVSPDSANLDFVPPAATASAPATLFGLVVLFIGAGVAVAAMFVRARELAALQAHEHEFRARRAARPLSPGPGRVLCGVVDTEEETDGVAVRVEIAQFVKNSTTKNRQWHTWRETSRDVQAAPFYLRRDDDQVVYVEPTEDALVVDELENEYPRDTPNERLRSAKVERGERVHVYGDLHRGHHPRAAGAAYRGAGGEGYVLRAPSRGRMLLATEAIEDRYKARIQYLRRWGVVFGWAWFLSNVVFTVPYLAATCFGRHEVADVVSHRTYDTKNKNQTTRHYVLTARAGDGFTFEGHVIAATYGAIVRYEGPTAPQIPITRTGDLTFASYLGNVPALSWPWLLFGAMGFAVTAIVAALRYRSRPAWYDRPTLVEEVPGHWDETRPKHPIDPRRS